MSFFALNNDSASAPARYLHCDSSAIATFKIMSATAFGDEPFVTADMDLSIIGLATKVKMRDSSVLCCYCKKNHHEFKYNHRRSNRLNRGIAR